MQVAVKLYRRTYFLECLREEAILAHRKIAANRLVIDCIYVLSKEELSKVDRELEWIASDFLMQDLGIRR